MNKWKKVKISDSFILQMGKTPSRNEPSFWNNPLYNWVSISDMNQKYICSTKEKISPIALEKTGIKKVPKGTIMLSFKLSLGKVSISALDLYTNEAIMSFFPKNKNEWNIDFLYNYFKWLDWGKKAQKAVKGSTLNKNSLGNIEIPLPPMEEQKKIAARLDAVSDLLAKQKQLLSEQDNLIQSTFYDMFGDPIKNNKGWKIEKLGNLFSVSSGGTPDTKNKEYWENGDISWIGSNLCQNVILTKNDGKFITQKGLENSSAKIISAGSVLIALVGATIGKTALLTFETTTNQNIAAIDVVKNDNFSSYFIFYLIQALYQEFLNIGSGKFKMANLTFVRNLKIPIPPLELQEKFATIVKQIESEKSKIKSAIAETQTLFNALMSEYFEE